MIYKVAIVDDEPNDAERLYGMLKSYEENNIQSEISFNIREYNSGDGFLNDSPERFDIIFLDINMSGTNGLKTAALVREKNTQAAIIFCTHYAQYAVKGYEVNALGYLIKPFDEKSFCRNLNRAILALKRNQSQKLSIKTAEGMTIVSVSDIVYVEVKLHNIYYYVLSDGSLTGIRTRGTMREAYAALSDSDFSRCCESYLVNFRHVTALYGKDVILRTGKVLPVSRKFAKQFSDSFMKYLGTAGIR